MGSQTSSSCTVMKTWSVARYMAMKRPTLLNVRDSCLNNTDQSQPFLTLQVLKAALVESSVAAFPDAEIILDLHTMWDSEGNDHVPLVEYLVSLSPLACGGKDSFQDVLRFALDIYDMEERRVVSPDELSMVLRSLNATAMHFGDIFLSTRRILQLVDDIVYTLSMVERRRMAGNMMMHEDVISILARDPTVQQLLTQKLKKRQRVTFAASVDEVPRSLFDDGTTVSASSGKEDASETHASMDMDMSVEFSVPTTVPPVGNSVGASVSGLSLPPESIISVASGSVHTLLSASTGSFATQTSMPYESKESRALTSWTSCVGLFGKSNPPRRASQ